MKRSCELTSVFDAAAYIVMLVLAAVRVCQASDGSEFHMPYERAAAMSLDQFMNVFYNAAGDNSDVVYTNGMDYYANSLLKRTDHRARRLTKADRARWRRFETAMHSWQDLYFKWYSLSMGNPWWDRWFECDVRTEQLDSSLETALTRHPRPKHKLSPPLVQELSSLANELYTPTGRGEPDDRELPYRGRRDRIAKMRRATSELTRAYISLQVNGESDFLGCIRHFRKRVRE